MTVKADNMKLDTIQFYQKIVKPGTSKNKTTKEPAKEKVELKSSSLQGSSQPYDKPLIFESLTPVNEKKLSSLRLVRGKDTTHIDIVWADSISHRRFIIDQKWKEKTNYSLLIPKGRLTDIFGAINDSVIIQFNTMEERDYGTLTLDATVKTTTGQWIIQLMNDKDGLIREKIIKKSDKVTFDVLAPGKYLVKFIYDINNNGVWDTGNYLKHRQPEKVIRYPKVLEMRAFFEDKETVELKPD
jgi:hypothetical protein